MSPDPVYEVRVLPSSLPSFQLVHPSLLTEVNDVLKELGSYLTNYPERTFYSPEIETTVYRHPSPLIEIGYSLDPERPVVNCVHVATPLPPRLRAFVSYSHKDRKHLEEFRQFVFLLEEQGWIEFWHDGEIEAGTDWDEKLQKALRSARAAVLLVTPNFLFSRYIRERELPVLKESFEKGAVRVFWIPYRHAIYEDFWFAKLQALCDPSVPLADLQRSRRDKCLKDICRNLKRQLTE